MTITGFTVSKATAVRRRIGELRQPFRLKLIISDIITKVRYGVATEHQVSVGCSARTLRFCPVIPAQVRSGIAHCSHAIVMISLVCVVVIVVLRGAVRTRLAVTIVLLVGILSSRIAAVDVPGACGVALRVLGDLALRALDIKSSLRIALLLCRAGPSTRGCSLRASVVGSSDLVSLNEPHSPPMIVADPWDLCKRILRGITVVAILTIPAVIGRRLGIRHRCGLSPRHGTIALR